MQDALKTNQRWVEAINTSGESIPPFSVCVPAGFDSSGRFLRMKVVKPTTAKLTGPLFFNDRRDVAINGFMRVTSHFPAWANVNSTVADGVSLTAVNAQWYLTAGPGPFIADGTYGGYNFVSRPSLPACDAQNCKIQVTVFGTPTGGTFKFVDWLVDGTTADVTFDYNETAAGADTALALHGGIAASDVTPVGGDFPDATIEIEFVGDLATTDIPLPLPDFGSLTGGTGVGVICSYSQLGIA